MIIANDRPFFLLTPSFFFLLIFPNDIPEVLNHIRHIRIRQLGMQRQGDQVFVVGIGVREILDIPAKIFVCSHHRQRLIVDIRRNASLGQLDDDLSAGRVVDAGNAGQIQVV